jgi:hypothetical protein
MQQTGRFGGVWVGCLVVLVWAAPLYAQPASPSVETFIDIPRITGSCGGLPTGCAPMTGVAVVAGWARDVRSRSGTGIATIEVRLDGVLQRTTAAIPRRDVAAVYGPQFLYSGWEVVVSVAGLAASNPPNGLHLLDVRVVSSIDGGFGGVAIFVDVAPAVAGHIDVPAPGASVDRPVQLAGWAADSTYRAGNGIAAVRVYETQGGAPVLVATASYGLARPDVAAAYASSYFPDWYHSGWSAAVPLSAGSHTLLVRVLTVTGSEQDFPGNAITVTVR